MERWGAFLDLDLRHAGVGVVFPGPKAELSAVQALMDLRLHIDDAASALSFGSLSFRSQQSLGARHWTLEGPAKDQAVAAVAEAKT